MTQGIISGAVWFALFLVVHAALFHRRHVENCFSLIIRVYFVCVAGHAGTILFVSGRSCPVDRAAAIFFYGLLVMGCLFILYMPFFYNIVNSLSLQTLILLTESPTGTLPLTDLQERFAGEPIVRDRMDTMAVNGYLTERDGSYCLTPGGRTTARFFGAAKDFWSMGAGG